MQPGTLQAFSSGLENSALGGEGFGIERFNPQRGPLQISSNLRIPNIAKVLQRDSQHSEDYIASVPPRGGLTSWRRWSPQEMIDAENAGTFSCNNVPVPISSDLAGQCLWSC